jgi:hypothetical protein
MPVSPATATRASVTACIIARDEEERLPACLASVAFCDEVVVVDSGSTDATVAIARAAGATVVEERWHGFAIQRNIALDHAHGDWVLEIDADERVSDRLREEIEAFLAAPPAGVELCGLPLRDHFLGRALGPSAKYPKYRHRLFRRDAYRHDEHRTVHEGLVPHGPVHPFTGDLLHLLAGDWNEALRDAWRYARLETAQLDPGTPVARIVLAAFVRPSVKLVYRLTVDGGWRDGLHGLAKIGLDCGGDAIAWLGLLGRRRSAAATAAADPAAAASAAPDAAAAPVGPAAAETAQPSPPSPGGPPRLVGVAYGADADRAASWLAAAAQAGADVALVTPCAGNGTVRRRALPSQGPFALTRALDAETQLRDVDAVVPFGRRARVALRLVPGTVRGTTHGVGEHDDPARAGSRDG